MSGERYPLSAFRLSSESLITKHYSLREQSKIKEQKPNTQVYKEPGAESRPLCAMCHLPCAGPHVLLGARSREPELTPHL